MKVTLSHLYFLLTQERGRTGPPQQLAEAFLVGLLQQAALERPQPEGVVHLNQKHFIQKPAETHSQSKHIRQK